MSIEQQQEKVFEYRAVGYALATARHGNRLVKWSDGTCSQTNHQDILDYDENQRFECSVRYVYIGTSLVDVFEKTEPELLLPRKLPTHDILSAQRLWDRIVKEHRCVEAQPADVDEEFWLKETGEKIE
jgi:hypothetical protein